MKSKSQSARVRDNSEMTIIGEEGGFFGRGQPILGANPIHFCYKIHIFVTCATARIRADKFNFRRPVSECKNLNDLKDKSS